MTWLNRILLALLVTGALAFLPSYEQLMAGSEDLARVRAERDSLADSNQQLREEIRLIEAEVAALQPRDDQAGELDRELARIAREDLNMIAPGEVVFEVQRPADQPKESAER